MLLAFLDGLPILIEKWILVLASAGVIWAGCILLFSQSSQDKAKSWQGWLLPGFFFIISLILRLAFLKDIFVPPYFDSVEHYRIVKGLVTGWETFTLPQTLTPAYYHLGFHFLASLLTSGLRADVMDVILVLGQVILAAIPIPVCFIIREETRSNVAAFFAMLLAGFGWYMPGFAVNWGKYPALAGLLAVEVALGVLFYTSNHLSKGSRRRPLRREQIIALVLLVVAILVATLFHTRMLVVMVIAVTSWFIAGKLCILPKGFQYGTVGLIVVGILAFGVLISVDPLLNLALDPYLGAGLWVTLAVFALSPFVLIRFPREVYFTLLFILGVFAILFIPVPAWIPVYENQTLLDRPLVEMVLYLPLSLLGGLGLAGGYQFLLKVSENFGRCHLERQREIFSMPERRFLLAEFILSDIEGLVEMTKTGKNGFLNHGFHVVSIMITVLLACFAGHVLMNRYDFYPSGCCQLVDYDDTIALDWIETNLPRQARILAAATEMNVLPSGPTTSLVGTDAGAWIPALTGRSVLLAPFDSDFQSKTTLEKLCQGQVDYIYVGSTEQRFNLVQLQAKENWYKGILFLPNAQLYQLTGCAR